MAVEDRNPHAWTAPTMERDLKDPDQAIVRSGLEITGSLDDGFSAIHYEPKWTEAGSYKLGNLLLLQPDGEPEESDWKFLLHCSTAEYRTSEDAEAAIMDWLGDADEYFAYTTPYYSWPCNLSTVTRYMSNYWPGLAYGGYCNTHGTVYIPVPTGIPLCGIILRNNGTTGTGRHFMPIDAVNRGRSYTWPRDLRPQWIGT